MTSPPSRRCRRMVAPDAVRSDGRPCHQCISGGGCKRRGLVGHSIGFDRSGRVGWRQLSMAAGEFVSVSSQNNRTESKAAVEGKNLASFPEAEEEELTEVLTGYGLDLGLAGRVAAEISERPEAALRMHTREEFGVHPDDLASPWVVAGSSMVPSALGAVIPLIPNLGDRGKPRDLVAGVRGRPIRWGCHRRAVHQPARSAQWVASDCPRGGQPAITYGNGQTTGASTR